MYCKNCGKGLPDDARFCDRCNMSVRKKSDKQGLIDELKEDRLARRQAKAVEERLKKIKKAKNKKLKTAVIIAVIVVVTGILSVVVGWIMGNVGTEKILEPGTVKTEQTEEPKSTPDIVTIGGTDSSPTTSPTSEPVATLPPAVLNNDGYYVVNLGDMEFAYPVNFKTDKDSASALLSLYDIMGDAVLVVEKTTTASTAEELMNKYISSKGGTVMEKTSDADEYEASIEADGEIFHRKGCVLDGAEIYYEISYPADSQNRQQYISAIKYMDAFFTSK